MSQFKFKCPNCQKVVVAEESMRGSVAKCPFCEKKVFVPKLQGETIDITCINDGRQDNHEPQTREYKRESSNQGNTGTINLEMINLVNECRKARNRLMNAGFLGILVGGAFLCSAIGGWISWPWAVSLAIIFSPAIWLIVRFTTKMVSISTFRPESSNKVAQALELACKSSCVWYGLKRTEGKNLVVRSTSLPFPMKDCNGVFAYYFGKSYLVPLKDFVIASGFGGKIEAVFNNLIQFNVSSSSKSTNTSPPKDSKTLSIKWLHTRVDGMPDRRYNYNPRRVVYEVGILEVVAQARFSCRLTFSDSSMILPIRDVITATSPVSCPG